MARADIRDVAKEAGVSIGTVSNVLNRPHLVAEQTRQRVLAVIDRTGFVRNAAARHLRQGRSRTIGLVVHDITNPFFTEIARTAADAATESGYLVFLCHSGGSPEKESAFLRALAEQQVRGVLLTPLNEAFPAEAAGADLVAAQPAIDDRPAVGADAPVMGAATVGATTITRVASGGPDIPGGPGIPSGPDMPDVAVDREVVIGGDGTAAGTGADVPSSQHNGIEALLDQRIPLVLVDRPSEDGRHCSVAVDDRHGAELATTHLLDTGRRQLAYVCGPPAIRQYADRGAGVRQAMRNAGLDLATHLRELSVPDPVGRHAAEVARRLLDSQRRPDGIVCGNDVIAIGVMRELLRAGVRVPDDIALVGYDDIDFATTAPVALTSVRQPTARMSRLATELLLAECELPTEHVHQQLLLKPDLVIRESSRPAHA